MKKTMALLLVIVLLFACTPALAQDWKYESEYLGSSIMLPDTLEVLGEFKAKNEDSIYLFFCLSEDETQITCTLSYVPEYKGLQTKDLPKKEIERWKAYFLESYPKHSKSMLIKPKYYSSQRIYRFYGMSKGGNWMLNYTGVKDGMYVSVCCEAGKFGYKKNQMRAVFDIFNYCFKLFASGRGVDFVPFSADDYEVEIFNLLYNDSPDSVFRTY